MSLFGGGAGGWVLRHFKWSKEKAEEEERQRRRRRRRIDPVSSLKWAE